LVERNVTNGSWHSWFYLFTYGLYGLCFPVWPVFVPQKWLHWKAPLGSYGGSLGRLFFLSEQKQIHSSDCEERQPSSRSSLLRKEPRDPDLLSSPHHSRLGLRPDDNVASFPRNSHNLNLPLVVLPCHWLSYCHLLCLGLYRRSWCYNTSECTPVP